MLDLTYPTWLTAHVTAVTTGAIFRRAPHRAGVLARTQVAGDNTSMLTATHGPATLVVNDAVDLPFDAGLKTHGGVRP